MLSVESAEILIGKLISNGIEIKSASNKNKLCVTEEDNLVAVAAFGIKCNDGRHRVLDMIRDAADNNYLKFYSVVVVDCKDCSSTWNVGNMTRKIFDADHVYAGPYRTSS
jgi:hypothetical protein